MLSKYQLTQVLSSDFKKTAVYFNWNLMCVYAAELICSTGVSCFQTLKPVFCICNKLRLHAEMLS